MEDRERFEEAFERLRANLTEPEEEAEIGILRQSHEAALRGDANARNEAVASLRRIAAINRAAMHAANQDVKRLGWAGAWATLFLGVLGFAFALAVTRRLEKKVTHPISNLHATLQQAKDGDVHIRCGPNDAQDEIRALMQLVNELLDRWTIRQRAERSPREIDAWRDAALHLMDAREEPCVLLDGEGHVVAANQRAMQRMSELDDDSMRQALDRAGEGEAADLVLASEEVGAGWRLCSLSAS